MLRLLVPPSDSLTVNGGRVWFESGPSMCPQLSELSNIVMGIRLFNRHIGKGGAGLVDLPRKVRGGREA